MMNPRTNKKSRSTSSRGGRGKGVERQLSVEGVYANHHFMHTAGTLVGLPVQVLTKTKEVFEGVLSTFGPRFELVLDLPHVVSSGENLLITNPDSIKRKMIFAAEDIVLIKVINVDLDFATRESFAVDSAISKFNGQVPTEKELEPWHGEETSCPDLGLGEGNENGWDADDMFRKNEEKYGVMTTYSPEMEGYTTPLHKRNTREWREQEAKAQQIAQEIEHSPATQTRAELENGEDEEEKFSAVIRPDGPVGSGGPPTGKYMPPQRRKLQGGTGARQPPRGTPSPQSGGGGGGPLPMSGGGGRYGSGPSPQPGPPSAPPPSSVPSAPSASSAPSSASGAPPTGGPPYPPQQGQIKSHPHPTHKHGAPQPLPGAPAPQHSITVDTKMNGEAKDSRRHDPPSQQAPFIREPPPPPHKEGYHPGGHPAHHPHHHHHHPHPPLPQQQAYTPHPPPPAYHGPPPEGRRSEPREQREPRKPRNPKDEEMATLKKFSQDFTLSSEAGSGPDKKGAPGTGAGPPPPHHHHHPPQQPTSGPPIPLSKHLPPQPQQPPPPSASQSVSPQQQQPPPGGPPPQHQSGGSAPPPPETQASGGAPPQQQQQQVPPQGSSHGASQAPPPRQEDVPAKPPGGPSPDEEKVASSKLNPNAKEFILNPNAKPFSPRSPSTTTPPRVQTPQIAPPTQSQGGAGIPSVAFQPNMVHPATYLMTQAFPVTQTRFPKRGPVGNQRQDYTSPVQVAAATGPPILAQAPLTPITTHQTVPIPQNIMPQTHQYQYPGMPMMVRFSHTPTGLPTMVPAMVPTSMGLYYPGGEAQQNSQAHNPQHMYVTPGVHHHQGHQPHHVATPLPHPGQPPTPQGHSNAGGPAPPPSMPAQPPTPGPTPPQQLMYSGPTGPPMGGQPTIPQHIPQHSPHTAQSPHNPYSGHGAAHAALAAHAASHHAPTTQLVMLPPQMTPHMMPPGAPPPHSGAGHVPSSAAGYTPTSSAAMQHVNHAHPVHYIPGAAGNQVHPIPLVHHNQ